MEEDLYMKKINKACITTTHFKLETLQQILPLIPRGVWFLLWDLVQGFYNILVRNDTTSVSTGMEFGISFEHCQWDAPNPPEYF
jgi:hypothetical protein